MRSYVDEKLHHQRTSLKHIQVVATTQKSLKISEIFYNRGRVRPKTKMTLCKPIKVFFLPFRTSKFFFIGSTVVVGFTSDHLACRLV